MKVLFAKERTKTAAIGVLKDKKTIWHANVNGYGRRKILNGFTKYSIPDPELWTLDLLEQFYFFPWVICDNKDHEA